MKALLKRYAAAIGRALKAGIGFFEARDIAAIAGIGLAGYGFWLISPAVGFVFAGIVLLSVVVARGNS